MSLAKTVMNGGFVGSSISPTRYGHAAGATTIAMECAAELHEIFMEGFYEKEQIHLEAATEGVDVAGSRFEAALESKNESVFQKIKAYLKKLWEKVQAFFHNVKRFIDSVFKSGRDFVSKYKKDIENVKTLTDFEFKMYEYNDDAIDNVDVGSVVDLYITDVEKDAEKDVDRVIAGVSAGKTEEDLIPNDDDDSWKDSIRAAVIPGKSKTDSVSEDDFALELFKSLRGGATGPDDKKYIKVTDIGKYAKFLSDSKAPSHFTELQSSSNSTFKKALAWIDSVERGANSRITKELPEEKRSAATSIITEILRKFTSSMSFMQTCINTSISAHKTAYTERDKVYKSCIMAGISHYKKQGKK